MVESPPLDELAVRKRLVQARMELHRAELALYIDHTLAPIRKASALASQPMVRWGGLAAMAAMVFAGARSNKVRSAGGKVSSILGGPLRSFITTKVLSFLFSKVRDYSARASEHQQQGDESEDNYS